MAEASRTDEAARLAVAAIFILAVAWLNFRFVLVHFSNGGDLLDSGWFAWLLTSGDPWLMSPKSVSGLSYFNYHLSPYLSALSLFFHATGIDRFTAFALHQGTMFALLAGSLHAVVLGAWSGGRSAVLFAAAVLVTLLGDVVLQIASFPHPEIAILAFCALGAALWQRGRHWPASIAFALACFVREDGGLYAGAFLIALVLLRPAGVRATLGSREAVLAAAAIVVSAAMFWIKSRYFAANDTFGANFSGHGWDHVTPAFIGQRLADLAVNPHALTVLLAALVLAIFSWRYLIFPVLLSPLLAAELLAVRPQLGHFTAYYAMPFLVIWAGLFLVAGYRVREQKLRIAEPVVLLIFAILGSGPFLYLVQPPAWFPVAATALVAPVIDLPKLAADASAAIDPVENACVSLGVAALIPNDFTPWQVLEPESDLAPCRTIFLFNGDIHYARLRQRVEDMTPGPVIDGRIERYDQRP